MPSFFGTSSPKIIVAMVASTRPSVTEMPGTAPSGTPTAVSGPSSSDAIAGSARKPMIRLVRVTPIWAPESWVDRRPQRPPYALGLSVALAGRLLHRSTVDGDEGVLGCPEDPAREHQAHRDPEQQPFHAAHCGGSPPGDVRPATRAGGRLSVRAGTVGGSKYLGSGRGEVSAEVLRCRREPRRAGAQRQRGLRLSRPDLHARRRRGRRCCCRRGRLGDGGVRRVRAGARRPAGRSRRDAAGRACGWPRSRSPSAYDGTRRGPGWPPP